MTSQTMSFQKAFEAAHAAGMAAGQGATPDPMVIQGYAPIADGVCGFAWVQFPGNTAFGKWAKKTGKASPGYPTGLTVWVHAFNQSYEKKMAYATAFAKVIAMSVEPKAYASGRLD